MKETLPENLVPVEPSTLRLRHSKVFRLLGGLAVLALVLGGLAFALLRLLGPQDRFDAFALPYTEDFTDTNVKRWFTDSGVWSVRNEALVQVTNLEEPSQVFVPRRVTLDQPYHLSTYITFSGRTQAAGINFNAQYTSLRKKAHRVYLERTQAEPNSDAQVVGNMQLVAGYTDDDGAFVPQVTLPFKSETTDYRLDLYVLGNTYMVQLNGQTLIEKRPLFYPNGLIGFYTLGPASFDTLKLTTAETSAPGELVYISDFEQELGGAGWVPFAGDWHVSEGELVQADPSTQNTGIGYEGNAFEAYVLQVTLRHLIGVGAGVLFNMPSPYEANGAQIVRFSEQSDALFWGYFDEAGAFVRQGFAAVDPPGTGAHQIQVFSRETSYDVYLDGEPVALDVEQQRAGGHIGLTTSVSSAAYERVESFPLFGDTPIASVQAITTTVVAAAAAAEEPTRAATPAPTLTPTPAPAARAPTPVPAATPLGPTSARVVAGGAATLRSTFTGTIAASDWRPISGRWHFGDGALLQENSVGFDQAIAYVANAFRSYSFEVSIAHTAGNGAGILFNMPFTDRLNGAHMVRYSDRRPGGIFWGYYDMEGKFVGQGYATVDAPADQPHVMRVVSEESTYSVFLDGAILAEGLPLQQSYGYIGMITNQSAAAFRSARVTNADRIAASVPLTSTGTLTTAQGGTTQQVVSGNWQVNGNAFLQRATEPADYIFNIDTRFGSYTLEAQIALPDKPEVGGGFIIQMPQRDQKAGAYVVRLIRGGEAIFWGRYDTTGAFQGQASAELPPHPEGIYQLRLEVRGDRMDIFVDDQSIAANVRLPGSEGWMGLLAFGGPITFSELKIVERSGD